MTRSGADKKPAEFGGYNLSRYLHDVEADGLAATWERICRHLVHCGESKFLCLRNFGQLYEAGLALRDKGQKKRSGQYYTPDDVAELMARELLPLPGTNLCDVACGTGRLILGCLDQMGEEKARELLTEGRVWLYDFDQTALAICRSSIRYRYGDACAEAVHTVAGDFLSRRAALPDDCKVIANPPYAKYAEPGKDWTRTNVQRRIREYYTAFMEKILSRSRSSVLLTPYSFISGKRFYPLRKVLDRFGGAIYSFDNVPAMIFRGHKHGVFNSNVNNSVRAAITVTAEGEKRGYRVSPLIRFKNAERARLLTCEALGTFLPPSRQRITPKEPMYRKCFPALEELYGRWLQRAEGHTLSELFAGRKAPKRWELFMPNTCCYYTAASLSRLSRTGQVALSFKEPGALPYAYCLFNSSFAYWYWRMFDGGIIYQRLLLRKIPSLYHRLTDDDRRFFAETTQDMVASAERFKITKKNVGLQESIRFPRRYRDRINARIIAILGLDLDCRLLDLVHSNMALKISVTGDE
ncbi:MAG: SAM-dependent DNA methyltransferase [Thermoguttaceae bacterium]|nr:SAM-dependent DNA methyltransferase [Thermoguttaceae bacterium]